MARRRRRISLAAMTTTQLRSPRVPLRTSALASLIPGAGFLGAIVVAEAVEDEFMALAGLIGAPFYLAFVALPSLLALAVARRGLVWISALLVITVSSLLSS